MRSIPGITKPHQANLAVLKPNNAAQHIPDGYTFTRWVASMPWWTPLMILAVMALWPALAHAQSRYSTIQAFDALWRWMPFLLKSGFFFLISSDWSDHKTT